jgi:hypothetical protein
MANTKPGKYVIISRTIINGIIKGKTSFTMSSTVRPETSLTTNRDIPKGGVINPIIKFTIITTPK